MIDEFEFFLAKEWLDGLPVVTPTEERAQRMLTGTHQPAEAVIGHIPPLFEAATVRTVAIHAVMAGCKPAYLPVVLGGLALMLREEFNVNGVQGTMHGVAPFMIVRCMAQTFGFIDPTAGGTHRGHGPQGLQFLGMEAHKVPKKSNACLPRVCTGRPVGGSLAPRPLQEFRRKAGQALLC